MVVPSLSWENDWASRKKTATKVKCVFFRMGAHPSGWSCRRAAPLAPGPAAPAGTPRPPRRPCARSRQSAPEKTVFVLSAFPYVCPKPVLVKRSHLYTNGSKKRRFFDYNTTVDEHEDDRFAERKDGISKDSLRTCRKRVVVSFQLFLCLSRACLGKSSCSINKMASQKRRFSFRTR
jgi:hypothetical protein